MSTTIGEISSATPTPGVAKVETGAIQAKAQGGAQTDTAAKQDAETAGITPVPIQPLSNRMLATFLQKDIELYGSTFGA